MQEAGMGCGEDLDLDDQPVDSASFLRDGLLRRFVGWQ
jgi:hypothetical protein